MRVEAAGRDAAFGTAVVASLCAWRALVACDTTAAPSADAAAADGTLDVVGDSPDEGRSDSAATRDTAAPPGFDAGADGSQADAPNDVLDADEGATDGPWDGGVDAAASDAEDASLPDGEALVLVAPNGSPFSSRRRPSSTSGTPSSGAGSPPATPSRAGADAPPTAASAHQRIKPAPRPRRRRAAPLTSTRSWRPERTRTSAPSTA